MAVFDASCNHVYAFAFQRTADAPKKRYQHKYIAQGLLKNIQTGENIPSYLNFGTTYPLP